MLILHSREPNFPRQGAQGRGDKKDGRGEESVTDKGKRGVAFGLKEKEASEKNEERDREKSWACVYVSFSYALCKPHSSFSHSDLFNVFPSTDLLY